MAAQSPTSQNIDITTRELSNTRIAFYCGDLHASEAILGQSGAEDKTNPLRPAEALIWVEGRHFRTSLYAVPNAKDLGDSNLGLKQTPTDVAMWEETYCHELNLHFPEALRL